MKLTVTPMIGRIRHDRTNSLGGCHALFEGAAVRTGDLGPAFAEAARDVLLSDYARQRLKDNPEDGVYVIVRIEP